MFNSIIRKTVFPMMVMLIVLISGFTVYAGTDGTYGNFRYTEEEEGITITGYSENSGVLEIPETINGKKVICIGRMAFYNCSGLTGSLTIPTSVTIIGEAAFRGCKGMTGSLTIPSSVTSIGDQAFYGCSGFTGSLTIPTSVKSIGNLAFYGCSGFTGSLTIPTSVTSIGTRVFYGCRGLTGNLTIPSSITSISSEAFYDCRGLTGRLTIPSSVTSISSGAFHGCNGLSGITVEEGNIYYTDRGCNGLFCNEGKTLLLGCKNTIIPEGVTEIGDSAFFSCKGLTGNLTLPSSVTKIGDDAFWDCEGLTGSLTIPERVTYIGNDAFSHCSGFTGNLTIPSNVAIIGNSAFYDCEGLTGSLTIPASATNISSEAFSCCSGFTGITVDEGNTKYSDRGSNGLFCDEGKTLLFGCKNTTIPDDVTKIDNSAFEGCSGLTGSLTIPASVTRIGSYAFDGCSGLTGSLSIPAGVTSIGEMAFRRCIGFTSITVEEGNTKYTDRGSNGLFCDEGKTLLFGINNTTIPDDVTKIDAYAFNDCRGLTGSLTMPTGLTSIGEFAFLDCRSLTCVEIPSSLISIESRAFYRCTGLTELVNNSAVSIDLPESDSVTRPWKNKETGETIIRIANGTAIRDPLPDTKTPELKKISATITGDSNAYDGKAHGIIVTVTDPSSGATVKYGTVSGTYDKSSSPEFTETGYNTVYYQITAEGYEPLTGQAVVEIKKAEEKENPEESKGKKKQTLSFEKESLSLESGEKGTNKLTGNKTAPVEYRSSDTSVAIVDKDTGEVTAIAKGEANITASVPEDGEYSKGEAAYKVTVTVVTKEESGHKHIDHLIHHNATEASETAAGNYEYWECSECGKIFRDEACTEEITLDDIIIPKKSEGTQKGSGVKPGTEPEEKPEKNPEAEPVTEPEKDPETEPVTDPEEKSKAETKEITISDNKAMDERTETTGDYQVTYAHKIPFPGKGKIMAASFGDNFNVLFNGSFYKVTKVKVNRKKLRIQITGLEGADKIIVKAVKKATKGDKGLSYEQNPYYVRDTDIVNPKFKKNGDLKSVIIQINNKDYKAKKGEFEYNTDTKVISFKGNLAGSYKVS